MTTLQTFVFPDPEICAEHDLYYHATSGVRFSQSPPSFHLEQGAQLAFDSYFNLLNVGKWRAACTLSGLYGEITGSGQVEIRVLHVAPARASEPPVETLYRQTVTLTRGAPYQVDLTPFSKRPDPGLIYIEITALEDGVTLLAGRFTTHSRPATLPRLAVSITTFKRETEVQNTVARFQTFLPGFEFGDQVRMLVVDNGNSARIPVSDSVIAMINPNYGGAGGFARGLLEAEDAGFSHCLFMDDDAAFHMENIARTYVFLALAKDPKTAVAGAMINTIDKWQLWENGAFFDGACHPISCGMDLRKPDAVFTLEADSQLPRSPTFYGGWWFFAFAIDQVQHHPFPFFVRGDDISFSLMNDFNISTLNGVVSFQDAFSEKENTQVLYLEMRSHLIHHLVTDVLDRSALGTAKIAIRFIMRSLLRLHYEAAAAQLLAWQDVMQGPAFFDANIDMQARRDTLAAMTATEVWHDINPDTIPTRTKYTLWPRNWRHRLGVWTLNGHLLPFSGWFWDRIVLDVTDRSLVLPAFGASRITYLNAARTNGYTVTQSKRRFAAICWQMTRTLGPFLRGYSDLKASYRQGYDQMTTREYWRKKLY